MTLFCDCLLWARYRFGCTNKAGYKSTSHSCFSSFVCTCKWAVVSLATPQDCCQGRAARGKVLVPLPLHRARRLVCCSARHTEPLPSSQRPHPLSLTSGAVLWPPRGVLLVKERRKRKREEAQPAKSLPCELPAHLRGWGMGGKGKKYHNSELLFGL